MNEFFYCELKKNIEWKLQHQQNKFKMFIQN